jgi:hypothetical protein
MFHKTYNPLLPNGVGLDLYQGENSILRAKANTSQEIIQAKDNPSLQEEF